MRFATPSDAFGRCSDPDCQTRYSVTHCKSKDMLEAKYYTGKIEAGCDEAGRGCLAGPVFAGAVILPDDVCERCPELAAGLNDSKQLTEKKRYQLRELIERDALAWAVGMVSNEEIDKINILRASILAMHRALDQLQIVPQAIIVDGNRFVEWKPQVSKTGTDYLMHARVSLREFCPPAESGRVPYTTIVKGDGKYLAIAAASILAKTYRDDFMMKIHEEYPMYRWDKNKGYPAPVHRQAIKEHGTTPYHRMSFNLLGNSPQLELDFGE